MTADKTRWCDAYSEDVKMPFVVRSVGDARHYNRNCCGILPITHVVRRATGERIEVPGWEEDSQERPGYEG
jgi:hypothetical protein